MLETGIGRAANMALATLPGFTLPGDISESSRYYHDDFVSPEIVLGAEGTLTLRNEAGIGFAVDQTKLEKYCLEELRIPLSRVS